MTVLVIGGSGFIGRRVVQALNEDNIQAISYDILNSNSVSDKTKSIQGDILELPAIERLLFENNLDGIIHLVGLPSIEYCQQNPQLSFQLNVLSVQNTLEAMRKTDTKRILFASSAAVYGAFKNEPAREIDTPRPNSIYGCHKHMAEESIRSYCSSYGLEYAILRLFNVYGGDPNGGKEVISTFLRRALKGESIVVRDPNKFRDFVHMNDIIHAFMKTLESGISNSTLNIGTGTKTYLRQIGEIMKEFFPKIHIDYESTPQDGTGLVADITSARNILEFAPLEPSRGIRDHISSFALVGQEIHAQSTV